MDKRWRWRQIIAAVTVVFLATTTLIDVSAAVVSPATPTVIVDPTVDGLVNTALNANTPDPSMAYYAITDDYQVGTLHVVSVAGLTSAADPANWTMADAVWMGGVAVDTSNSTGAVDGSVEYSNMTAQIFTGMGGSSQVPVFPFRPGTRALFGTRGVHAAGYGLTSWVAIDWLSGPDFGGKAAPNEVYASEDAQITYVCRDGGQIAVRAGNYLYAHLVDNAALDIGAQLRRGVKFASMITGDSNTVCGWTQQNGAHYHVHWAFPIPNGATSMRFEDWTFVVADGKFHQGNTVVGTNDWMTASGTAGDGYQPPTLDDGSFWSSIVGGAVDTATWALPTFPTGQVEIASNYLETAAAAIRVFYVLTTTHLRMNVTMWVFAVIVLLEPVRLIYALWMLIKRVIPFFG